MNVWKPVLACAAITLLATAPGVYAAPLPVRPVQTGSSANNAAALVQPPPPPFTPTIPVVASMLMTGPLDSYVQSCFQCPDPWSTNHSTTGVTSMFANPPAIDAPHPRSLALSTGLPTFQVNLEFDSNGIAPGTVDNPFPDVTAIRRGDVANFDVTLERCDAPQTRDTSAPPPPAPDCTDYAGNAGNWQYAASNAVAIGLPSANRGGQASLQLVDRASFDLGSLDLARTYHLRLHQYLQQTPYGEVTVGDNTSAEDTQYSLPFDVALAPAALYQGRVLPYSILYQPPGNLSAPSFGLSTGYGTQFTAGGSTTISNNMTDQQNHAVQASMRIGFDFQVPEPINVQFGGGFDVGNSQFWNKSTQWGLGTTATTSSTRGSEAATTISWSHPPNVHLVPGNGQMCHYTVPQGVTNPADYTYKCSPPEAPADPVPNERNAFEPYWQDVFILVVNPQFAVWTLNGQTRQIMTGSAAFVTAPLYQLNDCAAGMQQKPNPCHLEFADPGITIQNGLQRTATSKSVDLSPQEAAGLLKLDPFYASGSQAASLDATRAIPVKSLGGYGLSYEDDRHDGTPLGYTLASSYTVSNDIAKAGSQQYDMTVTDTVGNSEYSGFDFNFAGSTGTYTVTSGESTTSVNQVQMVYTDSTAVKTSTTTTSGADLNDEDNVFQSKQGADCPDCHDPLLARPRVAVYLDRTFGTFMFQDPDAPCGSALCNLVHENVAANPSQLVATSGTQLATGGSAATRAQAATRPVAPITPHLP